MPRKTFVSGDMLTAADMNLLSQDGYIQNDDFDTAAGQPGGAWTTWTPTTTGTITGTVVARYRQTGKTVWYSIRLNWAAGSDFDGLSFTLPVTALHPNYAQHSCHFADGGAGGFPFSGMAVLNAAGTIVYPRALGTFNAYGEGTAITNTLPFTWAAGDYLYIAGVYEAA